MLSIQRLLMWETNAGIISIRLLFLVLDDTILFDNINNPSVVVTTVCHRIDKFIIRRYSAVL